MSSAAARTPSTAEARGIELLYVDADVIVANKPSGLLVHRGWGRDEDVALFRVRDAVGEYVYPVHRLDRGTSGALLFARHRQAAAVLSRAFQGGQVDKRYLALVRGTPQPEGVIDHPIPRTEGADRVASVTRFRVLASSPIDRCSLVEAQPETGRLHQVRLHLRHLSHPLIGDVTHGRGDINRRYRALYQLQRLALHAHFLAFTHPIRQTLVRVSVPLPTDLAVAFAALGLPPDPVERVPPGDWK